MVRTAFLSSNRVLDIHLKIIKSDSGPLFCAFTKSEPKIEFSNEKGSIVMDELFAEFKLEDVRKHWSSSDFFGLTRSEVMKVICNHPVLSASTSTKTKPLKPSKTGIDSVLTDITNIRHRNAGPTGNL